MHIFPHSAMLLKPLETFGLHVKPSRRPTLAAGARFCHLNNPGR
jgi:hypothetical protein